MSLPIELEHKAYWATHMQDFDMKSAEKHRIFQLNEFRLGEYENAKLYKHDRYIKENEFEVGQQVFMFNSSLKIFPGKPGFRSSGPFTVVPVFPHSVVEVVCQDH